MGMRMEEEGRGIRTEVFSVQHTLVWKVKNIQIWKPSLETKKEGSHYIARIVSIIPLSCGD